LAVNFPASPPLAISYPNRIDADAEKFPSVGQAFFAIRLVKNMPDRTTRRVWSSKARPELEPMLSTRRVPHLPSSNPQQPDRHDGAQRRKAADGPSGCVGDFVVIDAAHQVGIRGC
jgi:hypothetical protein